jgi:hypothetical protein
LARPSWEPTEADIQLMEKLGGVLKQDQLAHYYGISVRQLHTRFKNNPEFRAAYDKARSDTISKVAQSLVEKALQGNLTAQIFYLKTQAGWWDKQTIEHTGPGGGAIEIETAEEARRDVLGSLVKFAARISADGSGKGDDRGGGGALEANQVRVDLLGAPGSVSPSSSEMVPMANVIGPGSGEDEDGS